MLRADNVAQRAVSQRDRSNSYLDSFFVVDATNHFDARVRQLRQVRMLVAEIAQNSNHAFTNAHAGVLKLKTHFHVFLSRYAEVTK